MYEYYLAEFPEVRSCPTAVVGLSITLVSTNTAPDPAVSLLAAPLLQSAHWCYSSVSPYAKKRLTTFFVLPSSDWGLFRVLLR
jgi:hypothetical protein